MWLRLIQLFLLLLGPRLIPRLLRTASLAWKLIFDNRVPLVLKLLLPASLLIIPFARVPLLAATGFVLLLSLAIFLLVNLAPQHVVDGYAPWRASGRRPRPEERDPAKVVEGSYNLVDEEEPNK